MMVVNNYSAIHSPCKSCKTRRQKEVYPNCIGFCPPVNQYLVKIGEPPHLPERKENLSEKYPPKAGCNFVKTYKLCTPEQYQEAHRRLVEIKQQTGKAGKDLAPMLDISAALLMSIIRGREQRTAQSTYEKIMGFTL